MTQFPEKPISIPKEKWDSVIKFFSSDRCSDQEIKEQIKNTYVYEKKGDSWQLTDFRPSI